LQLISLSRGFFTQTTGTTCSFQRNRELTQREPPNPADLTSARSGCPATLAHTCSAGRRTNGHVTRAAAPSSPPPDHQRDRAPGPAARPPGAARHVLGPPGSGLQAKKRAKTPGDAPRARWFRSAAANTTDAGLRIAVAVVRAPPTTRVAMMGLPPAPNTMIEGAHAAPHSSGLRRHMQDRIANHVAPHAALLFHQSKVYLLDAGAQRDILVACLRACVGCALSLYMRSALGYPATRVTLLIFPFSGAA